MAVILALEDPRNNTHFISGRLHQMGHEVIVSRDIIGGCQSYTQNKDRVQIAIADYLLPCKAKGTDLINYVRQSGMPVAVALIAHGELSRDARKIDGIPVIRRSLLTEELQDWVDQQLRRQVSNPRQVFQKHCANE